MLIRACLFLLLAAPAAAHENGRFGDPGVVVPNGRLAHTFTNTQPPVGDDAWATTLELHPGALFFVTRNVALGGSIVVGYFTSGEGDARLHGSSFGVEPRLGYNVAFSNDAGLFPNLGFGWVRTSAQVGDVETATVVGSRAYFDLGLPLLAHFGNYFLGFGPFLRMDLSAQSHVGNGDDADVDKETVIGFETVLGGWL
jgi:hypothetical protein